jgi:hypothetical protein
VMTPCSYVILPYAPKKSSSSASLQATVFTKMV